MNNLEDLVNSDRNKSFGFVGFDDKDEDMLCDEINKCMNLDSDSDLDYDICDKINKCTNLDSDSDDDICDKINKCMNLCNEYSYDICRDFIYYIPYGIKDCQDVKDRSYKYNKDSNTHDIIENGTLTKYGGFFLEADRILKIKGLPSVKKVLDNGLFNGAYVAGSSALYYFMELVGFRTDWKSSDVDIFIPGSNINTRVKLGNLDIVHRTESNIVDILLNFDLPCCRIAYDLNGDFWISTHCISTIYLGFYPKSSIKENKTPPYATTKESIELCEKYCKERLEYRIGKYKDRGFNILKSEHNNKEFFKYRLYNNTDVKMYLDDPKTFKCYKDRRIFKY
ncbi:Hypothetical protein ORPV_145 [Orpheovirus IHUMI-LCC2]|uniref:Uncharacterized protein n=1 Tax=Orpheovirus IHUMI-LCC2 TaxID=2023057 RepID=A0A2I2L3K4_9VIRU|nr:Hypothetical protein ORPV_145 [Orpheovirus IHUMI-LCC2]SNW62049.1 Hypothetical protein ORPV_145 [Orpheovirus IHUMI-LCC2]